MCWRSCGEAASTPRSGAAVYPDANLRLHRDRHIRRRILRLLEAEFYRNVRLMAAEDQHALATLWRLTVESWLRCQGPISIRRQPRSVNVED